MGFPGANVSKIQNYKIINFNKYLYTKLSEFIFADKRIMGQGQDTRKEV